MTNRKKIPEIQEGEIAKPLFAVTYLSQNEDYKKYYGHGHNPPDIRKGDSVDEVRETLSKLLPDDVKINSIIEIESNKIN